MKKIPSFKLEMNPIDEEARKMKRFQWASDEMGRRHKIGGTPDFLQEEDVPVCDNCKNKMSFYAQLDSLNDDFIIADCGMIYIFFCFDCNESKSLVQSY